MKYCSFGGGNRTLVVIPGLSTNGVTDMKDALEKIYKPFAAEWNVFVFDRLNDVEKKYTIREMADDTVLAMKTLGIGRASILGVSQGGMIAQVIAEYYPQIVEKLVLAATLSRQNKMFEETINEWTGLAKAGDWPALNRSFFSRIYTKTYLTANREAFAAAEKISPENPEKFIVLANACLEFDNYEALSKIKCPAMVFAGKEDIVLGCKAGEDIAEKLACQLYVYDNFGHAFYDEAPDFTQRAFDFLARTETSSCL